MNLNQVKYLLYALLAAVILAAFLPALLGLPWAGSIPLFLIPLAAYAAAAWKLWRCPHCGEHLGVGVGDVCPRCGKWLDGRQ